MSDSILIVEEHSRIRLGAKRQLQSQTSHRIVSCTPAHLAKNLSREKPALLIVGAASGSELSRILDGCPQLPRTLKVLLLLPGAEMSAASLVPNASAVVARETVCERLVSTVRFLLPPVSPRTARKRPHYRARATY